MLSSPYSESCTAPVWELAEEFSLLSLKPPSEAPSNSFLVLWKVLGHGCIVIPRQSTAWTDDPGSDDDYDLNNLPPCPQHSDESNDEYASSIALKGTHQ